nr:DUF2723 domain-containing protein [Deltaproteobacteria bacterium]
MRIGGCVVHRPPRHAVARAGVGVACLALVVTLASLRRRCAGATARTAWRSTWCTPSRLEIARNTPASTLVAAEGAGSLRFHGNRPVLDLVGLNDSALAHARGARARACIIVRAAPTIFVIPIEWERPFVPMFALRRVRTLQARAQSPPGCDVRRCGARRRAGATRGRRRVRANGGAPRDDPAPATDRSPRSSSLVAAAAYLPTAARSVLGGDNGEFATLFHAPGVAHPPGYPLYLLYLRALRPPAASPAHGAALATALLGAAAAAALFSAGRAWAPSRGAPRPSRRSLGRCRRSLAPRHAGGGLRAQRLIARRQPGRRQGPAAPLRGTRRAIPLGGLVGLGLANHHTIVLLAPLGVFAMVRARESRRPALAPALSVPAPLSGAAHLRLARRGGAQRARL